MTEIFNYRGNKVIRHDDGRLTRNGCPIEFTSTGRKYVVISYSNRHQYLCKVQDCYKNTHARGWCRQHVKEFDPPQQPDENKFAIKKK